MARLAVAARGARVRLRQLGFGETAIAWRRAQRRMVLGPESNGPANARKMLGILLSGSGRVRQCAVRRRHRSQAKPQF